MTTTILRTTDGWWLQLDATTAARIDTAPEATTGELLGNRAAIDAAVASADRQPIAELALVSPVTTPCRVVAQMTNYASHARDAGLDPEALPLTFFRKASGSVTGPTDDVIKPAHVRFLDYEVEVGLVMGKELPVGTTVTAHNMHEFVAGLVITNDISARDLQLPKTQFFESKSYPTFTPTGPALVLLDEAELRRFDDLRMTLSVNGEVRQDMVVGGDIIYPPLEALQTLSRFQQLAPGDLLLTGTPVGTALSAPPKPIEIIGSLLPAATKWALFFKRQASNPKYLQDGDVIESRIATPDGAIDLGVQRNRVRYAP